MSLSIVLLLIIVGVAVILFSFERLPADVIALSILLCLVLLGLLPPDIALAGFGSQTVLMILGLLVMTAGLTKSGVVDTVGRYILRWTGGSADRLTTVMMICVAGLSAFMSNTGATAFFLPIALSLSRQIKVSPTRLLMPLAFAAILASSVTLIGTTTNMVISGMMTSYDMAPLAMFELSVVGLPILAVGLLYMKTLGKRFIPDRLPAKPEPAKTKILPYLAEVVVLPESPLAGKSLSESRLGEHLDLAVLRVARGEKGILLPGPDLKLMPGDALLVEGERDNILRARAVTGIELKPELKFADMALESEDIGLYEVLLLPRSPMLGRTLRGLHFRERYGIQVLAINHHGKTSYSKLSRSVLRIGDQLLLRGNRNNIFALENENLFRVLRSVSWQAPGRRSLLSLAIFVGVLSAATLNLVPLAVAVLVGMVLMFVTKCITPQEAYREVEWKVLILIGSMLALGAAMERTGTAEFLASMIVGLTEGLNPVFLLAGFFGLTMLLTQPMSNQAAAVVVIPVALQTAFQLGLNPRAFAVMIALGASCSFLTPLEPACLLVYGPGNYRFVDFFKAGSILTVIILLVSVLLVPLFWPLR